MKKTVIVIPTYNEIENIERLITEITSLPLNLEILVVDDNSPDGTAKAVERMAAQNKRVHLLLRTGERGRGSAGIAGFKKALAMNADYIMEMDADFSHHPQFIPDFLEQIKHYDVVLGSRFVRGGKDVDRGVVRQVITTLANLYVRMVLQVHIKDCTSGYRCFRREALAGLPWETMTSTGPSIVQEVLYHCYLRGYSFKEIPIIFIDRRQGESTLNWKILFAGFLMVLKLRSQLKHKQIPRTKD